MFSLYIIEWMAHAINLLKSLYNHLISDKMVNIIIGCFNIWKVAGKCK